MNWGRRIQVKCRIPGNAYRESTESYFLTYSKFQERTFHSSELSADGDLEFCIGRGTSARGFARSEHERQFPVTLPARQTRDSSSVIDTLRERPPGYDSSVLHTLCETPLGFDSSVLDTLRETPLGYDSSVLHTLRETALGYDSSVLDTLYETSLGYVSSVLDTLRVKMSKTSLGYGSSELDTFCGIPPRVSCSRTEKTPAIVLQGQVAGST